MNNIKNLHDPTLRPDFPVQIMAAPKHLYAKQEDKYIPITCLALLNNGTISYCMTVSDNGIKPIKNIEVYRFNRLTRKYTSQTGGTTE
ncbi:hypothetical protein [Mammaliicoccus fleurettii]|uniref:hypothetical protein n=1 Tax=Mammaliicoccus fleurettii TaxID=150056 RepID=UPI002DBC98A2|nr:hypothetical protein [Mammaliicoccus fleurettii]MEB8067694.1 hypothetical protein [Mammaliicoccus fleurettii]